MSKSTVFCPFCSSQFNYNAYANHRGVCFRSYYINRMKSLSKELNSTPLKQEGPILKIDIQTPRGINNNLQKIYFKEQPFQKKYPIPANPPINKPIINNTPINKPIKITSQEDVKKLAAIQQVQKINIKIDKKEINKKTNSFVRENDEKNKQVQVIPKNKQTQIKLDPNSKFIFYKDQTYEEFLKNKRVIVVGPAQSVLKNNRDFIESFDVIVRLNKSLPISDKLIPYIGERTDILYNNLNLSDDPGRNRIPNQLLERYNVKYVSCPYPPIHPFLPDIVYFTSQNKKRVSFHHIPTAFYRKIEGNIQTRPNTGLCAVLDLLRYPLREIYITGITFFTDGYYSQYKQIHNYHKYYSQMNDGLHRQSPQREMIRNMYLMDTRIKVDKNLNDILLHRFDSFHKDIKTKFFDINNEYNLLYNNLLGQNIDIFKNDINYYQIIENYSSSEYDITTNNIPRIYINPCEYNIITENDILVLTKFENWNNIESKKAKGILMLISPSQFWVDSLEKDILSKIFVINPIQFKKYIQLLGKVDFHNNLSLTMFLIHIICINGSRLECSYFKSLNFSRNLFQNRKELLFMRYLEKRDHIFKIKS